MKKFKFRLQRVLDFREMEKEELLRDLAKKNLRVKELEAHLNFLEEAERRNPFVEGEPVDVHFVHLLGDFSAGVQEAIIQTRAAIEEAKEAAAEALRIYSEKLKEVKTLHALRERKQAEYNELVQKEETKFLDELAVRKGNTLYKEEVV